jgi:Fe-S cluster assembly ATP-binding protein
VTELFRVENLHAKPTEGDAEILRGLSITVNEGEVHAIMGPNGSGKSTLSHVIAGKPGYEVTGGQILFKGEDLLEMDDRLDRVDALEGVLAELADDWLEPEDGSAGG